jgi:putative flippase GtrA
VGLLRHLMDPRARPLRFVVVGGLTTLTYFGLTLAFTGSLGFPIQLAMACAYPPAVIVHFSGQRWFVFRSAHGFALAMNHQARRYLVVGVSQLVLSMVITSFVPAWLGVDERIVYLAATTSLTVATYLLLRIHVFQPAHGAVTAERPG